MKTHLHFLPPFIVRRLSESQSADARSVAAHAAILDTALRTERRAPLPHQLLTQLLAIAPEKRTVYTSNNQMLLPGTLLWAEGVEPAADVNAQHAFDCVGATYEFYQGVLARQSVDGSGLPLVLSVHYGSGYCNALWNGSQMVFGDGDGTYFNTFTNDLDVIAHELTHGVVQYTCALTYQDESGALNEHLADAFGTMVKQRALGQDVTQASWLVGETIFKGAPPGTAVRSLKDPGNAFNLPGVGKDPQVASMADYQHLPADEDFGGVHINSGIPNKAFYLAAVAAGGHSWETIGPVWYAAMTSKSVTANSTFADFATATLAAAQQHASSDVRSAIAQAWEQVGVPVAAPV
jgi:Zn-dependent metalloprotease